MSNKKNVDWVEAVILDDSEDEDESESESKKLDEPLLVDEDEDEEFEILPVSKKSKSKLKSKLIEEVIPVAKKKRIVEPLKHYFNEDTAIIEIGIDEAGRGPMFGRVYAGLAILPKDDSFDHSLMKDSKKFHSKKKIEQVASYIKENAVAWAVEYEDEQTIDDINILQATQSAMHKCIKNVLIQLQNKNKEKELDINNLLLLVDGNYFKPYSLLNKAKTKMEYIRYQMIEGGDNKYTPIAAASILAKVERDKYIDQLCLENPELVERYGIDTNKGYGSKKHMDGIKQYGITKWHRKTFGICKDYV